MQLIRGCAGLALALLLVGSSLLFAQSEAGHRIGEPRARDIGIPFDGTPGPLNAITDVAGVEVGYKTLISGKGKLVVGKGPVRTGVTAILPRGKSGKAGVFAGFFFRQWQRSSRCRSSRLALKGWVRALPARELRLGQTAPRAKPRANLPPKRLATVNLTLTPERPRGGRGRRLRKLFAG